MKKLLLILLCFPMIGFGQEGKAGPEAITSKEISKSKDYCNLFFSDAVISSHNVLHILVNEKNKMLVAGEFSDTSRLKQKVRNFLNNNGQDESLSDSPKEAIFLIRSRSTSLKTEYLIKQIINREYVKLNFIYQPRICLLKGELLSKWGRSWNWTEVEKPPLPLGAPNVFAEENLAINYFYNKDSGDSLFMLCSAPYEIRSMKMSDQSKDYFFANSNFFFSKKTLYSFKGFSFVLKEIIDKNTLHLVISSAENSGLKSEYLQDNEQRKIKDYTFTLNNPMIGAINIYSRVGYESLKETPDNKALISLEMMPEFPGGDVEIMKYIQENIKYPPIAKKDHIAGKVYISYIVDKLGSVTNVRVVKGVHKALDAEAVRVVRSLPQYIPGFQKGKPVRVQFTIPIKFNLG